MKHIIQELIDHHKNSRQEVSQLLEEISQIEESKLDYKELDALKESKIRLEVENKLRLSFINSLEDILDGR